MRIRNSWFYISLLLLSISGTVAPFNNPYGGGMQGMPMGGMPPIDEKEFAKFLEDVEKNPEMREMLEKVAAELEDEFKKLPPEEQERLNKQAEEELKRLNFDPSKLFGPAPQQQTPIIQPAKVQPQPQPLSRPEPPVDCSQVASHSPQQASCLLDATISYVELVRSKLHALNQETHAIQEWLTSLSYYLKIINKPEHVQRLTSITFNHLFELITELEELVHHESSALVVLHPEEEAPSDNPYAILGIPYDASSEEIKKAYDDHMSKHNPEQLKKDLEEANLSPLKIAERVRQAQAYQATLTDAFDQLNDENLRAQIDRQRLHNRKQQAALSDANEAAIERLFNGLEALVQQGIITELEEFIKRYAPQEAYLRDAMIQAEKNQFAQQKAGANPTFMPSPLSGYSPFGNYGGYQPPFSYPGNAYYPPASSLSPHSQNAPGLGNTAKPGEGSGGGGSGGGGAKKADDKKDAKKDEQKKADEKKKAAEDPDKKAKEEEKKLLEAVKKQFGNALNALKEPLTKIKEYVKSDEGKEHVKRLASLSAETRGTTRTIADPSFKKLHGDLKTHFNDEFTKAVAQVHQFATLIKQQQPNHPKILDECRPLWEAHVKAHPEAYGFIETLCAHIGKEQARNNRFVETDPWASIASVCYTLQAIAELFKKSKPDKAEKEAKAGKEKAGAAGKKETKPQGKEKPGTGKDKDKDKEPQDPKLIVTQVLEKIKQLEEAYKVVGEKVAEKTSNEIGEKLIESVNAAIDDKDIEGVLRLVKKWKAYLQDTGLQAIINLKKEITSLRKKLQGTSESAIATASFADVTKSAKKKYTQVVQLESLHNKILKFKKDTREAIEKKKREEEIASPPANEDESVIFSN